MYTTNVFFCVFMLSSVIYNVMLWVHMENRNFSCIRCSISFSVKVGSEHCNQTLQNTICHLNVIYSNQHFEVLTPQESH